MLTLAYYLHCFLTVAVAVCFADLLVQPGMLLAPVQRWAREWHRARYDSEIDERFWWKPLWGCFLCVSGQWAFWAYLAHYHAAYHFDEHVYFVALGLLFSLLIQWMIRRLQS